VNTGAGVLDGNGPIVAGDVPVELVVLVEEACAIAHAIGKLNCARGVDGVGDVNFQVAIGAGSGGVVFESGAIFVGDAGDGDEELVIRAVWAGILDGNGAVNAVPLSDENQRDGFVDQSAAVRVYGDGVLKI